MVQVPGPTLEAVEGDRVRLYRDQSSPRTYDDPLAWIDFAQWHGWGRGTDTASNRTG